MSSLSLYPLGAKAKSSVSGFAGTITARCDRLFGPNRYEITPPVDAAGKFQEPVWLDEGELLVEPVRDAATIVAAAIADPASTNPGNDSPQPTPPAEQPAS